MTPAIEQALQDWQEQQKEYRRAILYVVECAEQFADAARAWADTMPAPEHELWARTLTPEQFAAHAMAREATEYLDAAEALERARYTVSRQARAVTRAFAGYLDAVTHETEI